MLSSAGDALIIMADPMRLLFLFGGVVIGLTLGVIPGLGGLVGMALLLPFTFDMDKFAAFAFLLGMGAVTTTSDTIPAVLFGVPGTTGSAATILDGHPMARNGEAGRAFGAAYTASMMGGIFGALLLAVSIPILRPVMLYRSCCIWDRRNSCLSRCSACPWWLCCPVPHPCVAWPQPVSAC
jgi:TctA family transporter